MLSSVTEMDMVIASIMGIVPRQDIIMYSTWNMIYTMEWNSGFNLCDTNVFLSPKECL